MSRLSFNYILDSKRFHGAITKTKLFIVLLPYVRKFYGTLHSPWVWPQLQSTRCAYDSLHIKPVSKCTETFVLRARKLQKKREKLTKHKQYILQEKMKTASNIKCCSLQSTVKW